jgi:hypothetical protein
MARDFKDLVITELADDLAQTEALLVAYRAALLVAIGENATLTTQNRRLRECLRVDLERRFDVRLDSEAA